MKNVQRGPQSQDSYLWLEEVEGPKALEFARHENKKTLEHFKQSPMFAEIEKEVRDISLAKDRVPDVSIQNGLLYNFWQDEKHIRGLWRRTTISEYKKESPNWEVLLDLDTLAAAEKENWVWKGQTSLAPDHTRTLLHLSRGGKDATVIREFDLNTKDFVQDGFQIPEGKHHVSWKDLDTLSVGLDEGGETVTESGYPMIVREWKRGTPLASAKEIMRGQKSDMQVSAFTDLDNGKRMTVIVRTITFYTWEYWFEKTGGELVKIPVPLDASFEGFFAGYMGFNLQSDFASYKTGSMVAFDLESYLKDPNQKTESYFSLVFAPTKKKFLNYVVKTKNRIYANVMDNVLNRISEIKLKKVGGKARWSFKDLKLGTSGMASISSADSEGDQFIANYYDFLTPTSIYLGKDQKFELLKTAPARFDSSSMHVERASVKTKDGTLIPYFIVSKKKLAKNSKNPTLLYGYGGFLIPMQPSYMSITGKVWLERGGVYVLTNLRGGGEFGPEWHQSVLKGNRYKVYEDFAAIAEDLIAKKITSPQHLGIKGGSNGGLLVGATTMLRPELFNAVLCQVPLLDMVRYHKLLAGASWMGEYGNPDIPAELEGILKYSPYQKVQEATTYPEMFFMTSTKDDRVHPGHARKMVAKMQEQGHPVYYYENIDGGHARNANIEQSILWNSLEFTYLFEKLK